MSDHPSFGAHYAGRHRMFETKGVSHGEDPFSDLQFIRVPKGGNRHTVFCAYLNNGDISLGISSDDLGFILFAIFQPHFYC